MLDTVVLPFEPRFSFLAFVFLAFAIVRDGFTALPTLDVRDAESRLLSRDAPAAYSRHNSSTIMRSTHVPAQFKCPDPAKFMRPVVERSLMAFHPIFGVWRPLRVPGKSAFQLAYVMH